MAKPDRKTIGLRLDPENDAKLQAAAQQLSLSKSDVVNMMIRQTTELYFTLNPLGGAVVATTTTPEEFFDRTLGVGLPPNEPVPCPPTATPDWPLRERGAGAEPTQGPHLDPDGEPIQMQAANEDPAQDEHDAAMAAAREGHTPDGE